MAEVRKIDMEMFNENKKAVFLMAALALLLFSGCANSPTGNAVSDTIDTSLSDVKERGRLIVGSAVPFTPMTLFDENGDVSGIDIDIIKEVARQMGVEAEVSDYEWDILFPAIESNQIDIAISAITITPERSEKYLFSIPYFNGGQVVVTLADSGITSIDDLEGKKIGVISGTTCEAIAKEKYPSSKFEEYISTEKFLEDTRKGKIDLFILDYIAGMNFAKQNSDLTVLGEPFTQEYYGIVTNKNNKALMDEINRILREMKRTGKLKQLEDKWLE